MDKILTVVVPTYNMEKYLGNCLDSFIYSKDAQDLEVLIVNDGSKDKSLEIATNYVNKYPNIFKVIDKENGGHGSTINKGLELATGKYFKVVDSDDWVDTKELEKLLTFLHNTDVDCVSLDYVEYYEDSQKTNLVKSTNYKINTILNINEIEKFDFCIHRFVFKTEMVKEIRLTEKCFYVDVEYNLYCYNQCKTFIYLPISLYYYRLGRKGQSVSVEGLYKHREDHKNVMQEILNFYETNHESWSATVRINVFSYISLLLKNHYTNYFNMYFLHKEVLSELKEFDKYLQSYKEFYIKLESDKLIHKIRNKHFTMPKFDIIKFKLRKFIKKVLRKK